MDYGQTFFQFTVYARSKNIQLLSGAVHVLEAIPMRGGTVIACDGGGPITPRHVEVDLIQRTLKVNPGHDVGDSEIQYKPFAFDIPAGSSEVLQVIASADDSNRLLRWQIEIGALIDGEPLSLTINNNGRPFETIGGEGRRQYIWGTSSWLEQPSLG